jgi:hypothetical protein
LIILPITSSFRWSLIEWWLNFIIEIS